MEIIKAKSLDYKYAVSRSGDIYSLLSGKPVKMSPTKNKQGYRMVGFRSASGIRKLKALHRIIADTFLDNYENLPCVNHKDGNKLNNDVSNLEWCTKQHNNQHAFATGLNKTYRPVDTKLVEKAKAMRDQGWGFREIGFFIGKSTTTAFEYANFN